MASSGTGTKLAKVDSFVPAPKLAKTSQNTIKEVKTSEKDKFFSNRWCTT